jgi:hypothetical protein
VSVPDGETGPLSGRTTDRSGCRFGEHSTTDRSQLTNVFELRPGHGDKSKPSEAEAKYREALAIEQELADENPGNPAFQGNLAETLMRLGR